MRVVDAGANAAENNVRKERGKANTTMSIRGKVDAGGFEPPAFWLQTRRSSNLAKRPCILSGEPLPFEPSPAHDSESNAVDGRIAVGTHTNAGARNANQGLEFGHVLLSSGG